MPFWVPFLFISWEERLPMSTDARERAWLEHEIGRCYLALQNNEQARECAQNACADAEEAPQLHLEATMLLGAADGKDRSSDVICALRRFISTATLLLV